MKWVSSIVKGVQSAIKYMKLVDCFIAAAEAFIAKAKEHSLYSDDETTTKEA